MWNKIKKIYIGTKQVYPPTWNPWANTLVYLPLNWDALDQSGNSRDGTLPNTWNYSWEYINWVSWEKCFYSYSTAAWNNTNWIYWTYDATAIGSNDVTISVWLKSKTITDTTWYWLGTETESWPHWMWIWLTPWSWTYLMIIRFYDDPYTSWTYDNNRHNYIITYNDTNKSKMYVDWVNVPMTTNANASFDITSNRFQLWCMRWNSGGSQAYFSRWIIENKERTATEALDYYNLTKWNYWL